VCCHPRYTCDVADRRRRSDDERISLAPLDPEQALRALLEADPESKPAGDSEDDSGPEDK
jgi:hypothetical protein